MYKIQGKPHAVSEMFISLKLHWIVMSLCTHIPNTVNLTHVQSFKEVYFNTQLIF